MSIRTLGNGDPVIGALQVCPPNPPSFRRIDATVATNHPNQSICLPDISHLMAQHVSIAATVLEEK
jgi:hypothetical protein